MSRKRMWKRSFLILVGLGSLMLAGPQPPLWSANLSTDYTGVPPYVASVTTPNILMLMDNSTSMKARANCDPNVCSPNPDGTVNNAAEESDVFMPGTRYSGYFDSMKCYAYRDGTWNNSVNDLGNRFSAKNNKNPAALDGICLNDEWDGNLLNWITFRRIDALKKAMIGGECAAPRTTLDGTCPPLAGKITIQGNRGPNLANEYMLLSVANPTAGNQITGRIPSQYRYASVLSIHLRASGMYGGWFCVNDVFDYLNGSENVSWTCDTAPVPTGTAHYHADATPAYDVGPYSVTYQDCIESSCTDRTEYYPGYHVPAQPAVDVDYTTYANVPGGDTTAAAFNIRLALDTESAGVIQQVGSQARLGLMIFQPRSNVTEGGLVPVGIGARQSVDTSGTVSTHTTNNAAMVVAVQGMAAESATPLAESLYEAARYVAQIPPDAAFNNTSYSYPLAFGAGSLGSGIGSIGSGEQTVLGSTETCPPGYILNACGRDPYFFGQAHTPAWASPSAVVHCCKTFVIIVTDGNPSVDATIPDSLKEYAHTRLPSITQCAGTGCATSPNTPPSTLLQQHRLDYAGGSHYLDDVALWAHTVDLRPDNNGACTGPLTIAGINEAGHCLPGVQNLTLYTVYAFGTIGGREILMQAARQGGFVEDTEGDYINAIPTLDDQDCINPGPPPSTMGRSSRKWDRVTNATGLGPPDCIPDNYFESSNADDIRSRLIAAINKITESTSSGASASVLASSSTGEGSTYQAFFYQRKTDAASTTPVTWVGYLQGFFVSQFGNLHEDTDGDGKLVYGKDRIIKVGANGTADVFESTEAGVEGSFVDTVPLADLHPVWEAGKQLALTDPGNSCEGSITWPKSGTLAESGISCRRILTWVDKDNNGVVDVGERLEFTTANKDKLCPYLGGIEVSKCVSGGASGTGQNEAAGIINFIRGIQDPDAHMRERQVTVDGAPKVWKLGDIMASTPVSVSTPRERYDIIYGDADYAQFYQRYRDRRQVVYVGANDGMLHAFNGGFLSAGVATNKERIRFAKEPLKPGTDDPCGTLPCNAPAGFATYTVRTPGPLGRELWAFIPQDLLPQLRWLTAQNYTHTYYVDLKPKVTDARIFCNNEVAIPGCIEGNREDHPGGWGTILIGGMRFGGSCSNCNQVKGSARTVTADFGAGETTRVFLSSYFVLDITNPEKDPVLLWTFRDQDLGLTTAAPAVIRVNTVSGAGPGISSTDEKWYAVFGTGTTHYDGSSGQTAQVFVVDLKQGPSYVLPLNVISGQQLSGTTRTKTCTLESPCLLANVDGTRVGLFSTKQTGFMGDAVSLDANLDFRVDVIYVGSVFCNTTTANSPCNGSNPTWKGAMWRLTTGGGSVTMANWGDAGDPSKLISTFACGGTTCNVGPIPAASALSIDDKDNFWVFFGTGRLISSVDTTNTNQQHFFGVKDCIASNTCTDQAERNDLFDVSSVEICAAPPDGTTSACVPTTVSTDGGSTFNTSFDNFLADVQTKHGWFTKLPALRERSLNMPRLLGGTIFFSSFSPDASICEFGGEARLYGLYFVSGTAYKTSSLGDTLIGANLVARRSIGIETGMPSEVALHLGGQGTGLSGTSSGAGCVGRVTAFIQKGNAAISQRCATPALRPWSAIIAWRDM